MEFRLLGDLEVVEGGSQLPLGGPKQRAVLAALLLEANQVVSTDRLIEAVWGDRASARASGNLHPLVSRLRRTLGPERIERHAGGYLLRAQNSEIDLHRFERLRAEARLLPPAAASERLRLALDLWRGPALADFTYDSWAANDIQRIEELHLVAIEESVEADLAVGRHTELVGELQRLVAEHPLRESFRRQLILALYRSNRQAEALEAYQAARRMLDEELGLEPSPALRELEAAVLRQDPALDAPAPPARAVLPAAVGRRSRRRRLVLAAASALLAFGTAAAAVRVLNRGEAPRGAAVAAPATTTLQDAPRRRPRPAAAPKPTVVVRTVVRRTRERVKATPPPRRPVRRSVPARRDPRQTAPTAPQAPRPPPPPPAQPPPPPRKPAPVRIADSFEDGVLSRDIWTTWAHGTGAEAVERNGRLELTIAADAVPGGEWNMVSIAYGTVCRLLGDFDVRVEYELLEWPAANGAEIQLAAFFRGTALTVNRVSGRWGESYVTWHRSAGGSEPTADTRGAVRIRRRNGHTITYYRRGGEWSAIRGFVTDGAPNVGLQIMGTRDNFAHQHVRIAFDNFVLVAAQPVC